MNKIYKIIWSKAKNCYIVVSEIAKRSGKCSSSLNKKIIAAFLAAGTVLSVTGSAWAEETNSFPVGVVVNGTDNIIKGYDTTYFDTYPLNGAFTSIYGAYNTLNINKLPGDNVIYTPYSGIANTINGFGNFVKNANGAQVFGAGNTLNDLSSPLNLSDDENTIINDKIAILNAQESTENQKKAARDKINEILKKHLNETSSNLIVGMNNTLQGGQIQTSQYMNRHNIVVGFENSTQHIKETSIIGYGNNIKNTKDDIIIGNGHIWEGKSPSTPSKNNIILGKWDQEGGHVSNVQTLLDNVLIGHNADANKPYWYTEEPPVMNGGVMYSVAIGTEATVADDAAIAIGKRAVALKDYSVAIGSEATGAADSAIAVGKKAVAKGTDAIAIGKGALAENKKSTTAIAIGADSHADGERATAIGQGAYAEGLGTITIGRSAVKTDVDGNELGKGAMGTNAISVGEETLAKGNNAVSIGGYGQAVGEQTTAIGSSSKATSAYATAVGSGANATGAQSTATGAYSQAKGDYSVALGTFANYYGDERKGGITAVGYNSAVTVDNGVALGRGSVANTEKNVAGYDPTTGKASTDTTKTWKSTMGAVSVGSSTNTRQVTNVAAGYEDTDAVNVAQLKQVVAAVDGAKTHYFSVNSTAKGEGSNYLNDGAKGVDAIAIGAGALAENTKIGKTEEGYYGQMSNAMAIGTNSHADGERATAIGQKAYAEGVGALAIGSTNTDKNTVKGAVGYNAIAIGDQADAKGYNTIAIGGHTFTGGEEVTVLGSGAWGMADQATAIGSRAQAMGEWSVATGAYSGANVYSVAVGPYSMAGTTQEHGIVSPIEGVSFTTAVGMSSKATGNYSTAVGGGANATGANSTAVGVSSQAKGANSLALGTFANYYGNNSAGTTAVGYNTSVTVPGGVALGSGSVASTPAGVNGVNPLNVNYEKYNPAWTSTDAAVSVGGGTYTYARRNNDGDYVNEKGEIVTSEKDAQQLTSIRTRQITGVAAGTNPTDAVNVAQLQGTTTHYYSVNENKAHDDVAGDSNYDNSGATGKGSLAAGYYANAAGEEATAFGYGSQSKEESSSSLGSLSKATARFATAVGHSAQAIGINSTATGSESVAAGENSTAVGLKSEAFGKGTIAIGHESTAGALVSVNKTGEGTDVYYTTDVIRGGANNEYIFRTLNDTATTTNGEENTSGGNTENTENTSGGNTESTVNPASVKPAGKKLLAASPMKRGLLGDAIVPLADTNDATKDGSGTDGGNSGTNSGTSGTVVAYNVLTQKYHEAKPDGKGGYTIGNVIEVDETSLNMGGIAMGSYAHAEGYRSMSIGRASGSYGEDSTAVGIYANAMGKGDLALGHGSSTGVKVRVVEGGADDFWTTSFYEADEKGKETTTPLTQTNADGKEVSVLDKNSNPVSNGNNGGIAIGSYSHTEGTRALAVGRVASAYGTNSTAIGLRANAYGEGSMAFGHGVVAGNKDDAYAAQVKALHDDPTIPYDLDGNDEVGVDPNNVIGAIAMGSYAEATGRGSLSVGRYSKAQSAYSTAMGIRAEVGKDANNAIAIGREATVEEGAENSVAIGEKSAAYGINSTAFGLQSTAYGEGSMAFGHGVVAGDKDHPKNKQVDALHDDPTVAYNLDGGDAVNVDPKNVIGAVALGSYAEATGRGSLSVGRYSKAQSAYSTAMGIRATVGENGKNGLAIGRETNVDGENSVAIGKGSTVTGKDSIAIGTGHKVTGSNSGTFGDPNIINAASSYVVGNNSNITDKTITDAFILGNNASVTKTGGVALGSYSIADTDKGITGYDPATATTSIKTTDPIWTATASALSVGGGTVEGTVVTRQITNVAAGSKATDAVNVAQLKASRVEIKAGDNITVTTSYGDDGHAIYTLSGSPETVVQAGTSGNVTVDGPAETPADTPAEGSSSDAGTGAGTETTATGGTVGTEPAEKTDKGTYITNIYTVDAKDTRNTIVAGDDSVNITSDTNQDGSLTYTITAKAKGASSNVKVIDGTNTTVTPGTEGDFTTYAVNVNTNGKVASGDTGIVTGDTVYNETRVQNDGNYVKKDSTAGENISKLDEQVHENAQNIENMGNAINNTNSQINSLDNRMRKGLAGAAALAALHPMDFNPDDKLQFSAGVGNYRGETAAALGAFYRPDESVMFSIGGTFGNADNMVNAGITFGLDGTRNRITRSRTAMAREIQDLRSLVTQMAARMDRLENANGIETTMFPDVPENHWAYEYVEDLQKRGALKGYPDGLFKGDRNMTRYEFAAMLDRIVRSGVTLDPQIAKEFEPELGRIYVERISGQDNDRKKIERVRVNNSDSKYPEGKTRDVYGSKIQPVVSEKAAGE